MYKVTVLSGSGLVAKDRNMFGKKKSSDPFVKVVANGKLVGRTETQYKTLDPVFTAGGPFPAEFEGDQLKLELKIYDEDKLSADDPMGTVTLTLVCAQDYYPLPKTQWYEVPKDSAKKASGKLQVMIQSPRIVKLGPNSIQQLNPVYKKYQAAKELAAGNC